MMISWCNNCQHRLWLGVCLYSFQIFVFLCWKQLSTSIVQLCEVLDFKYPVVATKLVTILRSICRLIFISHYASCIFPHCNIFCCVCMQWLALFEITGGDHSEWRINDSGWPHQTRHIRSCHRKYQSQKISHWTSFNRISDQVTCCISCIESCIV